MKTLRWPSLIRAIRAIRGQFVFWLRLRRAVPTRNWERITARGGVQDSECRAAMNLFLTEPTFPSVADDHCSS